MMHSIYRTDFGDVRLNDKEAAILRRGDIAHTMNLQSMAWRIKAERQLVENLTAIARDKWEMAA